VIIARTDARATTRDRRGDQRANLYAAAGADVIFVEAPEREGESSRSQTRSMPAVVERVVGGRTPEIEHGRLVDLATG